MPAHRGPRNAAATSLGSAILASALFLALGCGAARAEDGWYTQAQADLGHQLFNNYCAECHRPDLSGAMGPALVGKTFQDKWGGKTLGDLYAFEHEKMPATNPGSIPPDHLWEITAYILEKNAFKAGTAELGKQSDLGRALAFQAK